MKPLLFHKYRVAKSGDKFRTIFFVKQAPSIILSYRFCLYLSKKCHKTTVWLREMPKEGTDFDVQKRDEHTEEITVSMEGKPFFDVTIQGSTISFLLTTALFPLRITQQLRKDWVLTKPEAKGKAYFGKLTDFKVNSELFPNITPFNPVAVIGNQRIANDVPNGRI